MSTSSSSFSQPARSWLATYTSSPAFAGAAGLHDALSSLVSSSQLSHAWTRAPLLARAAVGDAFITLDDLEAARPDPNEVLYWRATPPQHVAKVADIGLQAALALEGNVQFRKVGEYLPQAALLSLAVLDVLSLCTVSANVYVARGGQPLSRAAHTDAQFVFVLQTSGAKRWRVYAPPPPHLRPGTHPLERGKYEDTLEEEELGPPLLEATLSPGSLLFVPAGAAAPSHPRTLRRTPQPPWRPSSPRPSAGFPHATSTAEAAEAAEAAGGKGGQSLSVHVTLGVEAIIDQLTWLDIGAGARQRAMLAAAPPPPSSLVGAMLASPAHLGFLGREHSSEAEALRSFTAQMHAAMRGRSPLGGEIAGEIEDSGLFSRLGDTPRMLASVLKAHSAALVAAQRRLYRTVTAAPPPQPSPPDARTPPNGATAAAADVLAAAAAEASAARQRAVEELRGWYAACGAWVRQGECAVHPDGMRQECPGACAATLPSDADVAAATSGEGSAEQEAAAAWRARVQGLAWLCVGLIATVGAARTFRTIGVGGAGGRHWSTVRRTKRS